MSGEGIINRLRNRIEESEKLGDEDRESLLAFSDEMDLLKSTYSHHRHEKLLRHCKRIGEEVGGLTHSLSDKESAKTIVR